MRSALVSWLPAGLDNMSLILDALKRAERDRKNSHTLPDLHTLHEPAVSARPHTHRSWLLLLTIATVCVIIVGVILWYLLTPTFIQVQTQAHVVKPLVATATEATDISSANLSDAQASTTTVSQPTVPVVAVTENVKSIADVSTQANATSPELLALYKSANAEEDEPEKLDLVEQLYADESPSIQRDASSPVVSIRNYESLVEVSDIGSLPWGLRKEIPSINYSGHNFLASGASSVVINGVARRATDSLAQGLVLEEIYIDGVIVRYQQTPFKLRALSSWINM